MPGEAHLAAASLLAIVATLAVTPLAIALAGRLDFHDRPVGYKGHATATPYLGGSAVFVGFLLAALTLGGELERLGPIVAGAAAVWALGTVDDRVALSVRVRLVVEAGIAAALWSVGLGWSVFGSDAVDLVASVVWVIGLVNAFNLMDNMDGAAGTVGAVTAIATAALAALAGDPALAVLTAGLAGACLGFLPYNLARPARIFLGDGGSLPIGFVIAAALMALPAADLGSSFLLAAALLAGVPVVDTALVILSRRRAGVPLLSGGRDHLTHRLSRRLASPRTVALVLGGVQAVLGAVAIGVVELGYGSVLAAWSVWFVAAAATVAMLETEGWAPVRDPAPDRTSGTTAGRAPRRLHVGAVEAVAIAVIVLACGLSPFLYGFYDLSVWAPITLFVLAGLLGLVIGRPAAPRTTALVALAGLAGLWLWALLSTTWAESAAQAMTEANRWLLYAALFAVAVILLRNDRLSRIVVWASAGAIAAFCVYLVGRMLLGDGASLFLRGRLHEPLAYANGQAGYVLIGLWPLIALAERAERAWLAGLGVAGAVLVTGVAVLSQTRAIVPAVVLSALVLVAFVPGRVRRVWAIVAVAAGLAAALGALLEVYDSATVSGPDEEAVRTAAAALVAASAGAGTIWAIARFAASRAVWRRRVRERARHALAAAPLVVLALAIVAAAATTDPIGRVEREYANFVELRTTGGDSRFGSGAGNRYDYWRIAADQFRASPWRGTGAGNYDRAYFAERRTSEDVRQPHSLELQVLGELGLPGGIALALFAIPVCAGFARRARAARAGVEERGLAVAAGGAFLVWLFHTSVDWLHLIPGITGLALVFAAVLVGPWRDPYAERRTRARRIAVIASAAAVILGAALVGRAAMAASYRSDARDLLDVSPARAIAKANDSLDFDDEMLETYYVKAAGYARLDEYRQARETLLEATRREPHDFITWGLLGDLAARRGDLRAARAAYRRASRLNPRNSALAALADDPSSALEP